MRLASKIGLSAGAAVLVGAGITAASGWSSIPGHGHAARHAAGDFLTVPSPTEDSCARPDYHAHIWTICGHDYPMPAGTAEDDWSIDYHAGAWHLRKVQH